MGPGTQGFCYSHLRAALKAQLGKAGSRGSLMGALISFHKPGYPGALPGVDAGVDAVGGREGKQAGKQGQL